MRIISHIQAGMICLENEGASQMDVLIAECHRVLKKKGNLLIFMSIIKVETIINIAQES